jgi:hypothetical protein
MVAKPLPTFRSSCSPWTYVSLSCSIWEVSPRKSSTCAVGTYNFICTKERRWSGHWELQLTNSSFKRKSSSEAKVGDAHGS